MGQNRCGRKYAREGGAQLGFERIPTHELELTEGGQRRRRVDQRPHVLVGALEKPAVVPKRRIGYRADAAQPQCSQAGKQDATTL